MKEIRCIVVGSFNRAKANEVRFLLRDVPVEVRSLSDFPGVCPVPEDGASFIENASLKAQGLARQIGMCVVADDSGIEVDVLNGRPGVRSARYAGEGATDPERNEKLLAELVGVPMERRTARFRCAVACASPEEILFTTECKVEGHIAHEPRGTFGFGYDPIFIPLGYDRTFAELGPAVKHRISHRAQAFSRFREWLLSRLGRAPNASS